MRRYAPLALVVLAGAALVLAMARPRPVRIAAPEMASSARVARTLSLELSGGSVLPSRTEVPKGADVRVRVTNRDSYARRLSLLGYESEVSPAALSPGASVTVRFIADRPGSDFAWLVDGKPAGQFVVQGSHLVEGHR